MAKRGRRGGGSEDRNALKLITPEFRGSFVRLRRPESYQGNTAKYSITIPIDENDSFWDDLEEKIEAALEKRFDAVPKKYKSPVRDGDDVEYDDFEGKLFIRASSEDRPGIVDAEGEPIDDMTEVYSGAWFRASIRPFAWQHPQSGKGVSIQLDNVMKVRDDDPFSGRDKAENDFDEYIEGDGESRKRRRGRKKSDDEEGDEPRRGRRSRRDREEEDDDEPRPKRSRKSRRRGRDDDDILD